MTSFESVRLLKFKKIYILYIFLDFFLLIYIMCDKTHHFMEKIKYIASTLHQIMV